MRLGSRWLLVWFGGTCGVMLVGGEGVVLVFGIDVDFLVGISEITVY